MRAAVDPLDQDDFDPIDFINARFPDELSLQHVDAFSKTLDVKLQRLDDEIFRSVRDQALASKQAEQDIANAQVAIGDLFSKIQDIKHKAEQSEEMVQEICKDIRQLDYAKTHLTTTITALKRLAMMVTAITRLEAVVADTSDASDFRGYAASAQLLGAVNQILTEFREYTDVERVSELRGRVDVVKKKLHKSVVRDFRDFGSIVQDDGSMDPQATCLKADELRSACDVCEQLFEDTTSQTLEVLFEDLMRKYERRFADGTEEGSQLEMIPRRYTWFTKLLQDLRRRYEGAFPPSWEIELKLTHDFCERTQEHVAHLLSKIDPPETAPVRELLDSLKQTIKFEKALATRFKKGAKGEGDEAEPERENESEETKRIRMKYGGGGGGGRGEADAAAAEAESDQPALFAGVVSKVFEPYLASYVQREKDTMDDLVNKLVKEEREQSADPTAAGSLTQLNSSIAIFKSIEASMDRCVAISTGQTLFLVTEQFKSCLKRYARMLVEQLPTGADERKIGFVCFVINTGVFCADTVPRLAETIEAKIDERFRGHISFDDVEDAFLTTSTSAIKVLVHCILSQLDASLSKMQKMPWKTWETVGDESIYVAEIAAFLKKVIPSIRDLLSDLWFQNFCNEVAQAFLPRFEDSIFRCKRISEMGSQQMQLDTASLKNVLVQLTHLGLGEEEIALRPVSSAFTKFVTRRIQKVEVKLKIIGADRDCLVEMIRTLAEGGTALEYARIMQLKGIPKREQQELLRSLGQSDADIAECMKHIDVSAITDVGDSVKSAASSVVGRVFGRK